MLKGFIYNSFKILKNMKYLLSFVCFVLVLSSLSESIVDEPINDISLVGLYWDDSAPELLNCKTDEDGNIISCKLAGFTYYDPINEVTVIMYTDDNGESFKFSSLVIVDDRDHPEDSYDVWDINGKVGRFEYLSYNLEEYWYVFVE